MESSVESVRKDLNDYIIDRKEELNKYQYDHENNNLDLETQIQREVEPELFKFDKDAIQTRMRLYNFFEINVNNTQEDTVDEYIEELFTYFMSVYEETNSKLHPYLEDVTTIGAYQLFGRRREKLVITRNMLLRLYEADQKHNDILHDRIKEFSEYSYNNMTKYTKDYLVDKSESFEEIWENIQKYPETWNG